MKTHNSVKSHSANSLIASKNTRKIFTVTLCILLFVAVFTGLLSTPAYAQKYEYPSNPRLGTQPLDNDDKATVMNALKLLSWVLPTEDAAVVVGDASKPKSLLGKLANDKIRTKPMEKPDDFMSAIQNDYHDPTAAGDIYIVWNELLYATKDGIGKLQLTDLNTLLSDKLSLAMFRRLVKLAEGLYHEYIHTTQSWLEFTRDYDAYRQCKPRLIEMQAYWGGIRFKLDLKVKLLELKKDVWSPSDRERLDELDNLVLGEISSLEKKRSLQINASNWIQKSYLGSPPVNARTIISNIDDLSIGLIQTGDEPENIDRARQRAKNALDELYRIGDAVDGLLSEWERMKEETKDAMVYPNSGGTIKLPSGSAYVMIPPGGLQDITDVEIYKTNATGLITGENALSQVFGLGPDQISFDPTKPVRLYIQTNNTALIKDAQIYWWDTYLAGSVDVGWQKILNGREVDEQNGVISVEIDRSGLYVVILPSTTNLGELLIAKPYGDGPTTVDPCVAYDYASGELISNIYDTLLTFDGEHTDRFLPSLATSWTVQNINGTISPEGLPWYYRYTFQIRTGVKFQDGSLLTPQDVEYSLERQLVMDVTNGPQWMFYQAFFNKDGAGDLVIGDLNNPENVKIIGEILDHTVESDNTSVWINIASPSAYKPIPQILCQTWSSIMSKQWVNNYVIGQLGRPDWNGNWGDYSGWINFHNPATSPLDDPTPIMMGTGPFMIESLNYTAEQWTATRFVDYWRGWPADFPRLGSAHPAGYIDHLVVTWAINSATAMAMFANGDIDICAVPRQNVNDVLNQPGTRCIGPLPSLDVNTLFYNFAISPTSPYGPILPAGIFDETGIPGDFFGNTAWGIHVRKAFSYAIDYNTVINDAYNGEALHPATDIIPGLVGYDPTVKGYTYNPTAAIAEFKAVPGLWDTGFNITLVYNTGNILRQSYAELLQASIQSLNPKFHVNIESLSAGYQLAMIQGQFPTFIVGWMADYPDAHDFALPFYGTNGDFASLQSYSNPAMDALINQGIAEADDAKRALIYGQIQALAIADCPSIPLVQPILRHFESDWVNGWYYNPSHPGIYAYNLWKWHYVPQAQFGNTIATQSNRLPVDINYDGRVNIVDITIVAQAFGSSYGPPIHSRWNFRADIDNNRIVNVIDIAAVASHFTETSATWTPSP
jgi:peptide/nickel transport system substrate-binding protein